MCRDALGTGQSGCESELAEGGKLGPEREQNARESNAKKCESKTVGIFLAEDKSVGY